MTTVRTQWMDVAGVKSYPVFDALRRLGQKGEYTFPDMAKGAERRKIGCAHEWTVPNDGTLVGTAGHLHPGGLHTDLYLTRNGQTDAAVPLRGALLRAGGRRVVGRRR